MTMIIRRGRGLAFAICCAMSGLGQAVAADLPPEPSFKDAPEFIPAPNLWEGFYAGGHAGAAWSTTVVEDKYDYHGDPFARNEASGTDFIGGGQIGYNFQWGHFVFGPEIDLGYLGLSDTKSATLIPSTSNSYGLDAHYSAKGGFYGDITGRLGYAFDNVLIYAKGGAAFLDLDVKSHYRGENHDTKYSGGSNYSTFDFDKSETLWGWTAGAGVEYALTQQWSIKVEYQHFDFDSTSFAYDGAYTFNNKNWTSKLAGDAKFSLDADAVMAGINFRFGHEPELK